MVRKASTCSLTTIVPISAAIAEPARPDTIKEARMGTISRVIAKATAQPTQVVDPYRSIPSHICMAKTAPLNTEVTTTIGNDRTPISSICSNQTLV